MSGKFSVETKKTDIFKLNPSDIVVPSDLQGRAFEPNIENLAASIKEHGQLQPIGVRKGDEGKPVVVYGFSRLRAILAINEAGGIDGEPMLINAQRVNVNAEEAFILNLRENLDRNEVSPIDTAHNLKKLRERFGKTQKECGELYGKSAAWVAQHDALLTLSKPIQRKIHEGTVPLALALMLAELPEADRERLLAMAEELNGGKATRASLRQAVIQETESQDDAEETESQDDAEEPAPAKALKPSFKVIKETLEEWSMLHPVFAIVLDFANGTIAESTLTKKLKAAAPEMTDTSKIPGRKGK